MCKDYMETAGMITAENDKYNTKYYVTQDGHAITEPMTSADIVARFGPVRELESAGFLVVPA